MKRSSLFSLVIGVGVILTSPLAQAITPFTQDNCSQACLDQSNMPIPGSAALIRKPYQSCLTKCLSLAGETSTAFKGPSGYIGAENGSEHTSQTITWTAP